MGALFEVDLPDLHTGATQLATDAGDVTQATTGGAGACTSAGSACGGGPLAAALARLAGDTTSRGGTASRDVATGATTLTANAERYAADDADTSATFAAWSPGQAATFTGPGIDR
ncbi:hypothetical protein ACUN7V_10755 [Quadrisphaera oryzae]|uniref:hypothetical protein n=1 Tax=Quadrisphaera TaxID=317661 RepID=UPI001646DBFC|nr:hypothetical protein [Quadrisphaera sp. RL12-1S]MBC3762303.1 hypothetical protein [Quadrisphaera sp. RL12-1S]